MPDVPGHLTQLLRQASQGDPGALDRLVPLLYEDLREIARGSLRRERPSHTLSTTALVNEAYLRLVKNDRLAAEDRVQFCAIAATTMRRILVDYARSRNRKKRGQGQTPLPLDDLQGADLAALMTEQQADEMIALDSALERLAAADARAADVVQHRFFAGLSLEETSELLGVSTKTVQRSWLAARAWLRKEVGAGLAL